MVRTAAFVFSFFVVTIVLTCFISSCRNSSEKHYGIDSSSVEKGHELALKFCQSCHQFPDPSLLDKISWLSGVLPQMGPRLGIFYHNGLRYPSDKLDLNVDPAFYPSKPLLEPYEWQHILDYYGTRAPDKLLQPLKKDTINHGLKLFKVLEPAFRYLAPASCFVGIDSSSRPHQIFTCDVLRNKIYRFDRRLKILDSLSTNGPVVDMEIKKDSIVACNIGILNPNNARVGSLLSIQFNAAHELETADKDIFSQLARPVQVTGVDLNNDGKKDFLVCEFGNLTGALSWLENKGAGVYTRHVLRARPGAMKAYITDYNHDGLPDIWVLFGQGEEGVFLFTNKGKGEFEQQQVLRFPPVYGSSSFQLVDFNKDGYPDIIYTAGDNADFSPVLKPYHGLYIFLNDGNNHFKQKYFYPINGCYKAIAGDFDGDGDLDIATISFFVDFAAHPEEGFIYFENKGNYQFSPFTLPETMEGRWLTMNAGDIDGDGKEDLILGNFTYIGSKTKSKYDWKRGPVFLLLKNTGITEK